jgi:uncharacterized membrane protein YobD (UPF0266 family)
MMDRKRILPFEIKTTQLSQALIYLGVPLLLSLPVFVSREIRVLPYLISILLLMVVFLSFFLAAQKFLKPEGHVSSEAELGKESDEES